MKILLLGAKSLYEGQGIDTRTDRQTDRRDEANSCFSRFFESV